MSTCVSNILAQQIRSGVFNPRSFNALLSGVASTSIFLLGFTTLNFLSSRSSEYFSTSPWYFLQMCDMDSPHEKHTTGIIIRLICFLHTEISFMYFLCYIDRTYINNISLKIQDQKKFRLLSYVYSDRYKQYDDK